jgi:hypothetical protein
LGKEKDCMEHFQYWGGILMGKMGIGSALLQVERDDGEFTDIDPRSFNYHGSWYGARYLVA